MMKSLWKFKFWLTGLVLLLVSVAGATWLLNFTSGAGQEIQSTAKRPGLNPRGSDPVTCVGFADAESRVLALSTVQPGRVQEVLVKEDEVVKAGQVLLKLDDRPATYALHKAEAAVKAAETQLAEANNLRQQHAIDLEAQDKVVEGAKHKVDAAAAAASRLAQLTKNLNANPQEAQAAEALQKAARSALDAERKKLEKLRLIDPEDKIKVVEAELKAKKADLEHAEYTLKECNLVAPVDGRVLRILIGRGELVAGDPKQPLIQFVPQEARIIRAEVEQEFAGRVHDGDPATIEDDSHAEIHWKGKVIRISDWYTQRRSIIQEPLRFNDVRTLECIIKLELTPGQKEPRIGQRMRVTIGEIK
jgi:multidrug resistance efflux pump